MWCVLRGAWVVRAEDGQRTADGERVWARGDDEDGWAGLLSLT